ncbi:MAG: C1 family peptidase [Planctomycetota bacterium]|nr:C1 family peptidase [Planctomycetota bacterium]
MKSLSFHLLYLPLAVCLFALPVLGQEDETKSKPDSVEAETKPAEEVPPGYDFTIEKEIGRTGVKNQGSTGTCWCFATASFIESEIMRMGKGEHDLSEMFIVRNIYQDKAHNYIMRQGKANFGEGALAHDFMRAASRHGMVPNSVYTGLEEGATGHSHGEMVKVLEGVVKGLAEQKKLSDKWPYALDGVMDVYLGSAPNEFSYQGKTYTPGTFAQEMGFDAKNYVNLTSYTHHPFGESFALEIPDNFSSGQFQNMPIDDLVAAIDNAIAQGYTVAWDGDISERGFSRTNGLAIVPKDPSRRDVFKVRGDELDVNQEMRQSTFGSRSTTDDHLMHLVGIARDADGKKYYLIKNSWGDTGKHNGYLYMSEPYLRLKTVAVLMHKDALPSQTDETKPKT